MAACGVDPKLPGWLAPLMLREERVAVLPADQAAVEKFVLAASRAAQEGAAA
jgi:threonine synthase